MRISKIFNTVSLLMVTTAVLSAPLAQADCINLGFTSNCFYSWGEEIYTAGPSGANYYQQYDYNYSMQLLASANIYADGSREVYTPGGSNYYNQTNYDAQGNITAGANHFADGSESVYTPAFGGSGQQQTNYNAQGQVTSQTYSFGDTQVAQQQYTYTDGRTDVSATFFGDPWYGANIYPDGSAAIYTPAQEENANYYNQTNYDTDGNVVAGANIYGDGSRSVYTTDSDGSCHQQNLDSDGGETYSGPCG